MKGTEKQQAQAKEIIDTAKQAIISGNERFVPKDDMDIDYAWNHVSGKLHEIAESDNALFVIENRKHCVDPVEKVLELIGVMSEARLLITKGEITKESLRSAMRYYEEIMKMATQCEQKDSIKEKIRNCELAMWAIDNPRL